MPPRFIEAGIGGEVIADDLMNKIGAIRDIGVAASLDESKGVSRDRDEDIKVEIPDTGVSLGQAWHYLRLWLGHERRVTGNLRAPGDGASRSPSRLRAKQGFTLSGNEGDLASWSSKPPSMFSTRSILSTIPSICWARAGPPRLWRRRNASRNRRANRRNWPTPIRCFL